ncbi:MAG: biopolymer transporter ExbD [Pirellulales bacterium]|nr:biopolymer transporter ExbD [Pirellulales bacterium]
MHSPSLNFGTTGSEELIARRSENEMPEFDITAMVDLVFMMNIYFLVTFVAATAGLQLPSATHCSALEGGKAVVFTLARSLNGKSVDLYIGDGKESAAIVDRAQQEERIQAAVEAGLAEGKKDVLLKAEKKVRLGEIFRVAAAAGVEGTKLHIAVMEKEK